VKVLLIGAGGREHALAWKLSQSSLLDELHAAPGNPGIARIGECHPVRAEDAEGLLDLASSLPADLVVVGPEAPLVAGVADELRHSGVAVFGPGREAARIEGSKRFAKEVMQAAGVPTAATMSSPRPPCVMAASARWPTRAGVRPRSRGPIGRPSVPAWARRRPWVQIPKCSGT
jgi:phosphoribosylamine--glycine ligase